jgi:hypothetical protein
MLLITYVATAITFLAVGTVVTATLTTARENHLMRRLRRRLVECQAQARRAADPNWRRP